MLCVATVDVVCPSVSLHATVADGPPDAQQPPGGPDVVPAVFNAATVDPIHNPENSSATVEIASPSCLATATALPTSAGPVMAETDDLAPAAALCAAMDDRDDSASLLVNTPLRVLADNGAVAACGPLEVTEPTITTEAAVEATGTIGASEDGNSAVLEDFISKVMKNIPPPLVDKPPCRR